MRGEIVETRPAIDVAQMKREVHRAFIALQDAERAEQKTAQSAERAREAAGLRRLEMGRVLIRARKAWPARGPKAKGWGEFLRDFGIAEQTARDWMRLAGYVDEVSTTDESVGEIPTYAEAGIKKARPDLPPPTEREREAAYRREVDSSLPPRIEQRSERTHEFVEFAASARASVLRFAERNVHLTDVTTSPDDFMRAKQLLIDIVNQCLDELDAAGVLDGKERKRQLALLKGGRE